MQRLIDQRAKLSGKFTAKLFLVISIITGACLAYEKNGSDLQLIANLIRFFNLRQSFFKTSFLQKLRSS